MDGVAKGRERRGGGRILFADIFAFTSGDQIEREGDEACEGGQRGI